MTFRTSMNSVDNASQVGESLSAGVRLSSVYADPGAKVRKSVSIMEVQSRRTDTMTIAQAKKLKVGDWIHQNGDPEELLGEIHDTGYRGVIIAWPGPEFQTLYFDNTKRWELLTNPWAV